ncbi:hypothetical protein [uncultured Tissierella sp.]|uniref:hypothetical protein n=1 Tax=uncultured Tissierella sp. TaxID=448160 RepID=UPI00280658D3|nr:hypothetical protein [uncultured Tissierella sp.]MDU5081203.1 hypothetical protein [Bacillota bacterium]
MELKLNLKSNSYDYLINSIDNYEKSTNHGDHHLTTYYEKLKLKLSFILLCQSYELLLKSILFDRQENLIYTNIDLENFNNAHTVSFLNAINRVNNFTDYKIDENDKMILKRCNNLRNDFVHYQLEINFAHLRQEYLNLFILYKNLHSHFYGDYIKIPYLKDIKLEKQLNLKYKEIINDNNFTIFRGRDFSKEYLPEFKEMIEKNKEYDYYIANDGQKYKRIMMGSENKFLESIGEYERLSELCEREYCHDCLAKKGEYHLFEYMCDLERCPVCGRQILTCGCIKEMSK